MDSKPLKQYLISNDEEFVINESFLPMWHFNANPNVYDPIG